MHPHTFVVALTYNEDTEHNRRSARVFDYRDVSDFIKRLRRQMEYHLKAVAALSFIAAGEQGDRHNRCHWHVVLFGAVDFLKLGEWRAPWGVVTESKDIVSPVGIAEPWRRSWSLWPHGFVTVQEPDYGGMHYAMAYALKDQFNVRNAEGTGREAKAEVFGTGYLSMSKQPAIGARFIDAYLAQCDAANIVPPSRKLTVPEVRWPWWPSGVLRSQLLEGLAAINRRINEETGADGAGWSSLVHEARLSEDDLELLGVYDGEERETPEDQWRQLLAEHRDNETTAKRAQTRRACSSTIPCNLCLRGSGAAAIRAGVDQAEDGGFYATDAGDTPDSRKHVSTLQRDGKRKGPNADCALYGDPAIRVADFKYIWPATATEGFAEGARAGV